MTAHGAKYSTNKVVLDGSNDYFVLASGDKSEFNFLHHTESTVYVVLKRDSDVGYDVVIDTGGYSRARTGFSYALRPAANEYPYLHISNPNLLDLDRSATSYPDRVPLANTNLGIHMIKSTPTTMGDTAEYSKLTLNGRKVAKLYDSDSGVFTPTTQDSYHPLHIGVFGNGGASGYLDGDIAEVLIFDKILDADETTKVNAYLAKKWNLTATVDSDGDGFTMR